MRNTRLVRGAVSTGLKRTQVYEIVLIVNLAKGKIGEAAAALLSAMLVSKISLAALSWA